jgi:hypothetical protein
MISSSHARLAFVALEELKKEAMAIDRADIGKGSNNVWLPRSLLIFLAVQYLATLRGTLQNVLEEVRTIDGFWSFSDQDLVKGNLLEVNSSAF